MLESGTASGSSAETGPVAKNDPDRTYNPLDVEKLGRNIARALMDYPASEFPPDQTFTGSGVYTIHYSGSFPAYANLGDTEPIYVGKAEPPGKRSGKREARRPTQAVYQRLAHHARSIESANNLDIRDFCCRWLVLDPVWIGLTEQVLVSEYWPIWNIVVDGFGNKDPGRGRRNQRRSPWDTLHPGRPWAVHLQDGVDEADAILSMIAKRRNARGKPWPPRNLESSAADRSS